MKELPLPLVSVVIPCHNKTSTIKRAIDSVKAQSLNNLSCIIVDDSSSDNSKDVIMAEIANDKRFRYERVEFGNVALTRNYGVSLSDGLFVCPLDGDDWLDHKFLEVCVIELLKDYSLGAVYAGLTWHKPDESTGLSEWPGEWNYDKQLEGANQIPTCAVVRREAWERLGGQRARYCGEFGASTEDAEFWLRLGAYGWKAKKVTNEGLFHYSWMSGLATGNPEYQEVPWRSMHPWITDHLHPFASYATPKRWSHPVRQFDQPAISVIIPVGPGHEKEVVNALDSLEMQHFRKWEAVVVWDFDPFKAEAIQPIQRAYPYAKFLSHGSDTSNGAGWSRNLGVKCARAPLLLFLDADDVLADPHALDKMLQAWNAHEAIIYSDYLGKAVWDYEQAAKEFGDRLLHYHDKSQTAIFRKHAADYDCALAQRQPELSSNPTMPYYHWCLVSVLVPKAWHDKIGGFDETMQTWEDVDYMWRLARSGYCFQRVPEPLVMYSYHKGYRREKSAVTDEVSLQNHRSLIQYIKHKYEGIRPVGCNCGGKRQQQATVVGEAANGMNDQEFVMIEFDFAGSETRETYGKTLKSVTGQKDLGSKVLDYKGYSRRKGDRFLVHVRDQQARPDMFRLVPNEVKAPEVETRPLAEPVLIVKEKRGKREAVAA